MKTLTVIGSIVGALIVQFLTGCGPVLFGMKDFESTKEGYKINFITGFDTSASITGTDTLDNRKGIRPTNN